MTLNIRAMLCVTFIGVLVLDGASSAQSMGGGMGPNQVWRPSEPAGPPITSGDLHHSEAPPPAKVEVHLSEGVSVALKSLLVAAGQKDWTTAKAKLLEASAVPNSTDYDLFEINVMTSFVALSTGDHATALATYRNVVGSPFFDSAETSAEQSATLKNAMILANEAGDFPSAINFGNRLAALGPMDDASAIALAVAYFGNQDYADAQSLAQKAVDAAIAAGKKPDEIALKIVSKSSAIPH
jgi:hypothetical protein